MSDFRLSATLCFVIETGIYLNELQVRQHLDSPHSFTFMFKRFDTICFTVYFRGAYAEDL